MTIVLTESGDQAAVSEEGCAMVIPLCMVTSLFLVAGDVSLKQKERHAEEDI